LIEQLFDRAANINPTVHRRVRQQLQTSQQVDGAAIEFDRATRAVFADALKIAPLSTSVTA
jgi:hypothetical protein